MKKLFMLAFAMISSFSASAQFTTYQPVFVPSTPTTSGSTYSPFTIYEPVDPNLPAKKAPQRKLITLKGYYQKSNEWHVVPIRVAVSDEDIKLASVKGQHLWMNCNATVYEVGRFDPEIIRDNFNFKANVVSYGTIYF